MKHEIKSIRNKEESLTFRAMNAIKDYIYKNNLLKNSKLPSERELVELLGVSRVVVREAIKLLESLGLVKKIQGKGTYVDELKINLLSENIWHSLDKNKINLYEILEVRKELEKCVVKLAIEKINDSNLKELQDIIDGMKIEKNRIRYIEKDLKFHMKIIDILNNEFIKKLSSILIDFFMFLSLDNSNDYFKDGYSKYSSGLHQNIVEGLKKRNVKTVQDSMEDHFSAIIKQIKGEQIKS
jgi:GntR family transcriptional regulator, transcriptional repressor for pyruvate dehydrogenase complex